MKNKPLDKLSEQIYKSNKARGWVLLSPSDLAKSIVIESAELLEKFQWDETDRNKRRIEPKNWEEIGEEVADIYWYLVSFCKTVGINLAEAIEDKIEKNEKKYPVKMFKGKHNDKFYKKQKRKYRARRKK
jgi:dCTP diphosphatase